MQESFIFKPDKISSTEKLSFSIPFEEVNIPVKNAQLNAAHFKVQNSKGLVFFLHGNAGNLLTQEEHAKFYTDLGYDFFCFDYRGYGKSSSEMISEKQFSEDVQAVYNFVKKSYTEKLITVIGYSLGTCPASKLTLENNPSKLILIAPYYSMSEMAIHKYKILPTFLLKYKFDTYLNVEKIKKKILLIHGDKDETLPFEGSLDLSKLLGKDDKFIPIKNQGHNNFEENSVFIKGVSSFLAN